MEELETLPEGVSPEQEVLAKEEEAAETSVDPLAEEASSSASEAQTDFVETELPPVNDLREESSSDVGQNDIPAARGAQIDSPVPGPSVSMEELMAPDEVPAEDPVPIPLEDSHLRAVLEAIVYVAEEPLTLAQISSALQQPIERVRTLLDQLVSEFDKPEHGLTVREVAGGYKMATKAEHHEAVRSFVKSLKPPLKLSLPALETLAVIAYKQPVTSPEIMEIRGVRGAGVLNTLLDRKLIAAAGRKNVIGKPILYKTTKEFLIQFGLKDLSELPSLKEFEEIRRMAFADSEMPPEPPTEPASPVSAHGTPVQQEAASPIVETPVAVETEPGVETSTSEPPAPETSTAPDHGVGVTEQEN